MTSQDETHDLQIIHPDGRPMALSENLTKFLRSRPNKAKPFFMAHWLETLTEDELSTIAAGAAPIAGTPSGRDAPEHPSTDDVVSVALSLMAAERRTLKLTATPDRIIEWCRMLMLASSMEKFRRCGWVTFASPMSINPNKKFLFAVTELGKTEGRQYLPTMH